MAKVMGTFLVTCMDSVPRQLSRDGARAPIHPSPEHVGKHTAASNVVFGKTCITFNDPKKARLIATRGKFVLNPPAVSSRRFTDGCHGESDGYFFVSRCCWGVARRVERPMSNA